MDLYLGVQNSGIFGDLSYAIFYEPYHYTANAKRTNFAFDTMYFPPTGATQ